MLHELEYPFDSEYILKKSKSLKRRLLEENTQRIPKKIAVLGGSTTHDIIRILELFLLNQGIEPTFYESEYGMYWEDAMFGNEEFPIGCHIQQPVSYHDPDNYDVPWH